MVTTRDFSGLFLNRVETLCFFFSKYIMQTKREVDIGKRQRQVRMKTFKIKKTLNK